MGTGDHIVRRQYEGQWLGLPLKHVSLVAVGPVFFVGTSRLADTSQLTVQNTLFILVRKCSWPPFRNLLDSP